MNILVIDGQGGKIGALTVKKLKESIPGCVITAVGTNSIATSAMLKAGADFGATGENPVVRNTETADVIVGPIGIIVADSILGEVTPKMARAVGSSRAKKVLIPSLDCNLLVVGVQQVRLSELVDLAAAEVTKLTAPSSCKDLT